MAETRERCLEITGLIWAKAGARFEVTDVETGEKFRWLPEDAIGLLIGLAFQNRWTTETRGGVEIARLENN